MAEAKGDRRDSTFSDKYDDDFESEGDNDVSESKGGWRHIEFKEVEMGEQIGGGGVGLVYEGTFEGRAVALKTLFDPRVDDALKQEYLDELLVMSELRHPCIVDFIGACMKPPHLFFVMELCDQSLFQKLHYDRCELSEKALVGYAIDVASAMLYLHTRSPGIIHRDLKSQNLLIAADGRVKLCDFGLVRTRVTVAGTPAYMAPELLQDRPFSKAVDVYAFGVLLWELFTRQVPFDGYGPAEIRSEVTAGGRPRVPTVDCPRECQRLMADCWAQEPDRRPDFAAVLDQLESLHAEMPDSTEIERLNMSSGGGDALDALLG